MTDLVVSCIYRSEKNDFERSPRVLAFRPYFSAGSIISFVFTKQRDGRIGRRKRLPHVVTKGFACGWCRRFRLQSVFSQTLKAAVDVATTFGRVHSSTLVRSGSADATPSGYAARLSCQAMREAPMEKAAFAKSPHGCVSEKAPTPSRSRFGNTRMSDR
jgi:hypothetical protein